jgi:hypothetical protein
MKPKFCVDCRRHFSSVIMGEENHFCYARFKNEFNLVTGKPIGNDFCSWMRKDGPCKREGILFESK